MIILFDRSHYQPGPLQRKHPEDVGYFIARMLEQRSQLHRLEMIKNEHGMFLEFTFADHYAANNFALGLSVTPKVHNGAVVGYTFNDAIQALNERGITKCGRHEIGKALRHDAQQAAKYQQLQQQQQPVGYQQQWQQQPQLLAASLVANSSTFAGRRRHQSRVVAAPAPQKGCCNVM